MRRSVLLRFLGLSLAVALGAVIATAVLATYSTSEQLQGEIAENTSQLQTDGAIYARLTAYAGDHATWSGVDKLVEDLADQTGRRVALTDSDGQVIADSARLLGAGPDLPSMPAATIDARTGATNVAFKSSDVAVALPAGKAQTVMEAMPFLLSPTWGLTDEERSERQKLADQAAACLSAKGTPATVANGNGEAPQVVIRSGTTAAGGGWVTEISKMTPDDECIPAGLNAPSAKALRVNQDELQRAIACMTDVGEPYSVNSNVKFSGLQALSSPDPDSPPTPALAECTSTARAAALTPYVAPEARLYLGAKSAFNVFSTEGLLRTAATALGVLLIAALVMIVAGRRLVRPILALTGAAQRMKNGDHATRVPVSGTDEVARLGHAFNAMAESIQRHDFQRKAMVSDVAHELRTPLANIKGYLVASEDGVVPLDRELVSSLLEEADLLERLIVDLQDLALADAGMLRLHPATRDLSELAQLVVAAHRPAAETAGVTVRAEIAGAAPAEVDGARIRQALGNLVSNAIRFTGSGGEVVVGVRRVDNGYDLTVKDNGAGIGPEHLPHLFDRFYRAEHSRSRSTGGSGLGLAITKHLVEAHHGTITVTSSPGEGSTFTIHLPARHQAAR
ncbi:MAG TPA: HAMP domain-containing sensor histidine kinase [Kribbella sp.]|uniref:sensor histidine kinase n=1 Tax=Kribbella sp. TaxID=1871183 RepID=UPI002D78F3F6|nr:HAMP domain-containing sensor histidine kinase [Kribbella sp.]HET6299457.1 HAMP domain-containing sensor histidine kinase [Kribbella sp.]